VYPAPDPAGTPPSIHRWAEHTGEAELHLQAATEADVFREATRALAPLLGQDAAGPPIRHRIVVDAADRPALLAAWLEELVFLAESEGFVPQEVDGLVVSAGSARGVVEGRNGRSRNLVKAVTYHGLVFEPADAGWRAEVVLDV
jgi:Uncharacterized conserved protein